MSQVEILITTYPLLYKRNINYIYRKKGIRHANLTHSIDNTNPPFFFNKAKPYLNNNRSRDPTQRVLALYKIQEAKPRKRKT
jgi:hypothetical protein